MLTFFLFYQVRKTVQGSCVVACFLRLPGPRPALGTENKKHKGCRTGAPWSWVREEVVSIPIMGSTWSMGRPSICTQVSMEKRGVVLSGYHDNINQERLRRWLRLLLGGEQAGPVRGRRSRLQKEAVSTSWACLLELSLCFSVLWMAGGWWLPDRISQWS